MLRLIWSNTDHVIFKTVLYWTMLWRGWSVITVVWPATSENRSSGFLTRSDTNRAVQPQNMARDLKFQIWKEEGLYYPSGKNKGADQLRGPREADLRLCFRICKKQVFSRCGLYATVYSLLRSYSEKQIRWVPDDIWWQLRDDLAYIFIINYNYNNLLFHLNIYMRHSQFQIRNIIHKIWWEREREREWERERERERKRVHLLINIGIGMCQIAK